MSRFGFNNSSGNYSRFGISSIKWSPCCKLNLTSGAKFIAIAQMVMAFMTTMSVGIVLVLVLALQYNQTTDESPLYQIPHKHMTLLVLLMVGLSFYTYLHYYLFRGIKERNFDKVDRWWKIMAALIFVFFILSLYTMKVFNKTSIEFSEVFLSLFDLYSLWVIHAYRKELSEGADHTVEFERVL
ncbi:uncharacterized protein LOC110858143 [Folsomia candida]|uniref:uncharacterized protein LOC110858143 n=1 Tax=Folsomia candida TaxID=158441 RepID=UPI000B8FA4E7|nr:uncharacterized protein LOC110858143 [Folsomia candida]